MTEAQPAGSVLPESHSHPHLKSDALALHAEAESALGSQQPTSLAAANGGSEALPPTPPTMSQDGHPTQDAESLPHTDHVVNSLASNKSALSTPVNARSPPTPDPSPPRTAGSTTAPERPPMFTYPSSRAESFKTAREDPSEPSISPSITPVGDRLSTVQEDRGLGLAFEHDDNDITPTDTAQPPSPHMDDEVAGANADATAGAEEDKEPLVEEEIPHREWNTELMRNVTIRKKPTPKSSPRKERKPSAPMVDTTSPSPSPRPRRHSSLRQRVEASTNSPVTPSVENFAQSIGWPSDDKVASEEKPCEDNNNKRNSTSSMASSAVVEAKIIVTPPRRRQTLRRSGKNVGYRDEGSPTPDGTPRRHPHRQSHQSDEVPLHRLVHKRVSVADRSRRISTDSEALGTERSISSPLSFRSRMIDSSAATLAHQESLRRVLQPAADMLSRSSSITRPYYSGYSYHPRMSSAPEPVRKSALSSVARNYSQLSPPPMSPRVANNVSFQTPLDEDRVSVRSPVPSAQSPRSFKRRQTPNSVEARRPADINKTLPDIPLHDEPRECATQDVFLGASAPVEARDPPSALMERVRQLVAERETAAGNTPVAETKVTPKSPEQLSTFSSPQENSSPARRGSRSLRGRSGERRRSSLSQERASTSPEILIRPSLDVSAEEMPSRSYEWKRPSEEHGRVSFDRSTIRTEEHAGARHLFASTTPFSQFSDTPIEVSEATAVSIFPHNNHSLLVVQQMSRANSMVPEARQLEGESYFAPRDHREIQSTPTPPFVDANEDHDAENGHALQPTLTFEPSTPPMQIALPQPASVDSPLKNPRPPPEPPKILFIPPTPAEELERQLVPGPPKRSDSHPQRRLSLVQRARRYSDNLIPTLLARASSNRGRSSHDPHAHKSHRSPQVPSVSDEDGTLHPFWRPRGFWDGFDDSDSETESEEEALPRGGDTSDVEPDPPVPPKRTNTLGRRLTGGFRGSGGFLIGNSLGVERHGTNKRRHHVTLPPHFPRTPRTSSHTSSPHILIQPPTTPLGPHSSGGVSKRSSQSSMRSYDRPRRRASWRQGRSLPGLKKYQVQYIGISGVKERFKEGRREKRRQKIRQSIGTRYYVEPNGPNAT